MKGAIYFETITIPANGSTPLGIGGNFFMVKSADDNFTIIFDNKGRLEAGRNFVQKNVDFDHVSFENETGSDIDVAFYYGHGEIDLKEVTGNFQVENKAGTKLNVDDADTQGKLDDILALLQSRVDQRAPLTTLEGATFVSAVNAVVTICTAANNTNGVIIRTSNWIIGGAAPSGIRLDNTKFISPELNGFGTSFTGMLNNIYIPAGVKVELVSSAVNRDLNAWYEVL